MQAPPFRALTPALVTVACLFGVVGCAPELPPSLPSTDAHLRSASRIELVDLVISDPSRAEKVRRLYAEIVAELEPLDWRRTSYYLPRATAIRMKPDGLPEHITYGADYALVEEKVMTPLLDSLEVDGEVTEDTG